MTPKCLLLERRSLGLDLVCHYVPSNRICLGEVIPQVESRVLDTHLVEIGSPPHRTNDEPDHASDSYEKRKLVSQQQVAQSVVAVDEAGGAFGGLVFFYLRELGHDLYPGILTQAFLGPAAGLF